MRLRLKDCDVRSMPWWAPCRNPPSPSPFKDEAVGNVALIVRDDPTVAEIVCWLGEAWWRHGLATQATQAVTAWAWDALRVSRIYALVFEWNTPSVRVLEKAGYVLEGRLPKHTLKHGRLVDRLVYAAVRQP